MRRIKGGLSNIFENYSTVNMYSRITDMPYKKVSTLQPELYKRYEVLEM